MYTIFSAIRKQISQFKIPSRIYFRRKTQLLSILLILNLTLTGNSTERGLTSNIKTNDGHFPINTISKIIKITFLDKSKVNSPNGFPYEIFLEISRIFSLSRTFPKLVNQRIFAFLLCISLYLSRYVFFDFTVSRFSLYFVEK